MAYLRAVLTLGRVALTIPPVLVLQSSLRALAPLKARRFARFYLGWLNRTMGVRIEIEGEPVTGEPCLVISNHISWQDVLLIGGTVPVSFVAKKEVESWPLISTLAKLAGTVFIDRTRRHAAGETRNEMVDRLETGEALVLFPEGTTSDGSKVLDFKSALIGASQLEVNGEHVKVQPVTVAYKRLWGMPMSRETRMNFAWPGDVGLVDHLWRNLTSGPMDATIVFHPPTTVDLAGGRKKLAKAAHATIANRLAEELANGN